MMRAVIYCRVSTKEQTQNLSLPTQQKACIEHCQRHGFEVDRIFVEEGESAKTADRPEFQRMLTYCRQNKGHIHFVVVYSLSRFARDKYDHFVVRTLLHGFGVSLRSATEPIDESSTGKFMEGVLAAVAQFDNDVRAERTVAGMKAAIETGRWTFKAPIGYLNSNNGKKASTIIPDSKRGPLIQQAFELYATGLYTKTQILHKVTLLGLCKPNGQKISPQAFDQILRNPIYAGWLKVKNWELNVRGDHLPLVSQEIFDKVQSLTRGKGKLVTPHHRNHPDFPLRHFVHCGECGKPLTASWSKGRSKHYAYYHCYNSGCNSVNVSKEKLEGLFVGYMAQLEPKPEYLRLFREVVLEVWKEKKAQSVTLSKRLRQKARELRERKDQLVEAFVYKKAIDQHTYQDQVDRLDQEIALSEIELHEAEIEELDVEAVLRFAEHVVTNVSRLWMEFSLEQKQRFQKVLFPQGIQFANGSFGTTESCLLFNVLQADKAQKTSMVGPPGFEPPQPGKEGRLKNLLLADETRGNVLPTLQRHIPKRPA